MRFPSLIRNLQSVRYRLARRSLNHDFCFPAQSTHFLQFSDIRSRHRELDRYPFTFQISVVGRFEREEYDRNVDVRGDVYSTFDTLIATLEVYRIRYFEVVGFGL